MPKWQAKKGARPLRGSLADQGEALLSSLHYRTNEYRLHDDAEGKEDGRTDGRGVADSTQVERDEGGERRVLLRGEELEMESPARDEIAPLNRCGGCSVSGATRPRRGRGGGSGNK